MAQLQRSQGFTLIEMLMVIVIIGFSIGLVSLSVGKTKDESAIRKEAQTFLQAVDFVSERAVLNGEIIAMFLSFNQSADSLAKSWCYKWQRFHGNDWQPLPEETIGEHCLPEGMQWDLIIEGRTYVYEPELEKQPPVLVFSPSGETTAVEMSMFESGSSAEVQRIDIDLMGNTCWHNQEKSEGGNGCGSKK